MQPQLSTALNSGFSSSEWTSVRPQLMGLLKESVESYCSSTYESIVPPSNHESTSGRFCAFPTCTESCPMYPCAGAMESTSKAILWA